MIVSSHAILTVNPAFTKITGYTAQDVIGQKLAFLKSEKHNGDFYHDMWLSIQESGKWAGEIWTRKKDGDLYLEHATICTIRDGRGAICYCIGILDDVTEQYRREERFRLQAYHDPLTGLPNRKMLFEQLKAEIRKAKESNCPFTILFLDLDRLKGINDTLGHHVGDLLLKFVAKRLLACTRTHDIVARLGGDEFIVLLPDVTCKETAESVTQKIIKEVAKPYCIMDYRLEVTVSIGIALLDQESDNPYSLIQHADAAMYHAKQSGRNRDAYFDNMTQNSEREVLCDVL